MKVGSSLSGVTFEVEEGGCNPGAFLAVEARVSNCWLFHEKAFSFFWFLKSWSFWMWGHQAWFESKLFPRSSFPWALLCDKACWLKLQRTVSLHSSFHMRWFSHVSTSTNVLVIPLLHVIQEHRLMNWDRWVMSHRHDSIFDKVETNGWLCLDVIRLRVLTPVLKTCHSTLGLTIFLNASYSCCLVGLLINSFPLGLFLEESP